MSDDTLTQLAAPTGLTAKAGADHTVQLRWDAVPGAQAYEVHEMLKKPDNTFKERVTGTSSLREHLAGGHYRYGIRAVRGSDRSEMSTLADVMVPTADGAVEHDEEHDEEHDDPGLSAAAGTVDLTRWYLTLPNRRSGGSDHQPQEVHQPKLRTQPNGKYFRRLDGGAVEYVAPVAFDDAATTSGESGATRSELREMTVSADGQTESKPDWTLGESTRHALTCTLTCDPTSIRGGGKPRQECIVGQIHTSSNTPPLYLAVAMKTAGSGVLQLWLDHVDDPIPLLTGLGPGTRFSYRIEAKGSTCRVWAARGDDPDADTDPQKIAVSKFRSTTKCYFKAGAYNKTKIKDGKDGASIVRHFRLSIV